MNRSILFTCMIILSQISLAQKSVVGEYQLTGIHDMAAGLRFTENGRFDFYYIYGASDRNATGTYTVIGDTIKLKSDKVPGKDFTVKHQSSKKGFCKVVVKEENKILLNNIVVVAFVGDKQHTYISGPDGIIETDLKQCDSLYLQHQMFPDILSMIKDKDNTNNYFEVTLNPSLQQVSFKGIDFYIQGDTLTCHYNYFMPFEDITFVKE